MRSWGQGLSCCEQFYFKGNFLGVERRKLESGEPLKVARACPGLWQEARGESWALLEDRGSHCYSITGGWGSRNF